MTNGNNNCTYCGVVCGDSDQILDGKHMVCEDCNKELESDPMRQTLVEEINDDFMHIVSGEELNDYFYPSDDDFADLEPESGAGSNQKTQVSIL